MRLYIESVPFLDLVLAKLKAGVNGEIYFSWRKAYNWGGQHCVGRVGDVCFLGGGIRLKQITQYGKTREM